MKLLTKIACGILVFASPLQAQEQLDLSAVDISLPWITLTDDDDGWHHLEMSKAKCTLMALYGEVLGGHISNPMMVLQSNVGAPLGFTGANGNYIAPSNPRTSEIVANLEFGYLSDVGKLSACWASDRVPAVPANSATRPNGCSCMRWEPLPYSVFATYLTEAKNEIARDLDLAVGFQLDVMKDEIIELRKFAETGLPGMDDVQTQLVLDRLTTLEKRIDVQENLRNALIDGGVDPEAADEADE